MIKKIQDLESFLSIFNSTQKYFSDIAPSNHSSLFGNSNSALPNKYFQISSPTTLENLDVDFVKLNNSLCIGKISQDYSCGVHDSIYLFLREQEHNSYEILLVNKPDFS